MSSFWALLLGSKHVRHCLVGFYVIWKTSGLSRVEPSFRSGCPGDGYSPVANVLRSDGGSAKRTLVWCLNS